VVETRKLIKDLGKDHTIILSTHILPEVEHGVSVHHQSTRGHVVGHGQAGEPLRPSAGAERVHPGGARPGEDVVARIRQIKGVKDVVWEGSEEKNRYVISCRPLV